VYLKSCVVDW